MNIRITRKFHFEMAHALYGHRGPCKNIHGHSYCLAVSVIGKPRTGTGSSAGMVMDFADLKRIVKSAVLEPFDHALVLNGRSLHRKLAEKGMVEGKIYLADYQPTCENLLIDFAGRISALLPRGVRLHHLLLKETETAFAEWFADDNLKREPDK